MIPLWLWDPLRRWRQGRCDHDWRYDEVLTAGPWTGYIERCAKCGALQQIAQ